MAKSENIIKKGGLLKKRFVSKNDGFLSKILLIWEYETLNEWWELLR